MKRSVVSVALATVGLVAMAAATEPTVMRGTCMGTTYAVTMAEAVSPAVLVDLRLGVADELERLEQIFSLYRTSSELSQLNVEPAEQWISVSADLLNVAQRSLELAEATDGAFDPTVGPLMRLWRLRQVSANWSPPTTEEIADVRRRVGWRLVELRRQPPGLRKLARGVELDFNALVEGWAIDRVANLLEERGVKNALISLGGEFRGLGGRADGQAWQIGIENPHRPNAYYARAALIDAAVSTSGTYRQAVEFAGRRYGHVLDARTGEPIQHEVCAVSVVAEDAVTADGWATALLVLGPSEGLKLAEKKGLAASFVLTGRPRIILTPMAKNRMTLTAGQ